jgi:hypothetical protein
MAGEKVCGRSAGLHVCLGACQDNFKLQKKKPVISAELDAARHRAV